MPSGTLRARLRDLRPPSQATFSIAQVSERPRAYVAIDRNEHPALLVETSGVTVREIVRRGLRLQHRATCHVAIGGEEREITASLVACETDDAALQEAFISVSEIVLSRLRSASEAEVAAILEELVELLERPGEPSREGAIGLFAELLVLSLARDPCQAVHAWRIGEADRYDITCGQARIEVKASGTRERRHRFSLEQCVPDPQTDVLIASTLVLEGSGGTSVRDLAERVQGMVKTDATLVMKIQRALLNIMGVPRSGEPTFDEAHAVAMLRWFDLKAIPAIRDTPPHIDQVHFRTDLSLVAPLSLQEAEACAPDAIPCLSVS